MNKTNTELANLFISMGDLLKDRGANPYRIKAYHRAADVLTALDRDVADIARQGDLGTLPGIGKDLSSKIREFLDTGKIQAYEELKTPLPADLQQWIQLPGFSEALVHDLYFRLQIRTLGDLKKLAGSHLLRLRLGAGTSTSDLLDAIDRMGVQCNT